MPHRPEPDLRNPRVQSQSAQRFGQAEHGGAQAEAVTARGVDVQLGRNAGAFQGYVHK